ncbi:DUF2312 domain-containing protein [Acuticoccus sp. I52.16.1]|uniref:DUF2312 domain-containing protein n=1 Tax=Acuticoccus sp. I52.16.1 TaxID=2928472 RepID=UPI001FD1BE57|nr:DUF2312 domain-containing protein [Acuticoccus sp. I52.16.1]UOM35933.1 DUF2312 domain-containing protein [Acuticoccus sp. I52.16.1]
MVNEGVAGDQLRAIVERIERLEEEKQGIADDIKDVYAEAKANGFDAKVLRQIVRLRKQEPNERTEFEAILDLYMQALGMRFTEEGIERAEARVGQQAEAA